MTFLYGIPGMYSGIYNIEGHNGKRVPIALISLTISLERPNRIALLHLVVSRTKA